MSQKNLPFQLIILITAARNPIVTSHWSVSGHFAFISLRSANLAVRVNILLLIFNNQPSFVKY